MDVSTRNGHQRVGDSDEGSESPPLQGRGARNQPRSKKGCYTCRTKKVKCDEELPKCLRCIRLRLFCDYTPRSRRRRIITVPQGEAAGHARHHRASDASLPGQLSSPGESASSLVLTSADHEAIRYFRTTFAKIHHTKCADFSLYAIIFKLAEEEPMIMRVILALGGQEIEHRRRGSADGALEDRPPYDRHAVSPLHHYDVGIGLMRKALAIGDAEQSKPLDLDVICAALFLMLLYEEKHGDARCTMVSHHLAGAASVIQYRSQIPSLKLAIMSPDEPGNKIALTRRCQADEQGCQHLSLFSARLLVYLALRDSAASTFGLGGQLNAALNAIRHEHEPETPVCDGADSLHRFSYALYRTMWVDSYPQSELIDDIENRHVYSLLVAASQLRFRVAQLAQLDTETARAQVSAVQTAIKFVGYRFSELIGIAADLSVSTDNTRRIVGNIRGIVPHYYAALVEFARVNRRLSTSVPSSFSSFSAPASLPPQTEHHIRAIMNLALQAFKHEGNEAMVRISWPLFIVALETEDDLHRDWVRARFQAMRCYGKNLDRAYRFLEEVLATQSSRARFRANADSQPTGVLEVNGEVFVI